MEADAPERSRRTTGGCEREQEHPGAGRLVGPAICLLRVWPRARPIRGNVMPVMDDERAGWQAWVMVIVIVIAYTLITLWVLGMLR